MFQTVPLSIIRSFSLYTQQWYMSYSLQAVWHIPLLRVLWKTPDDGQRNCLKHVEFCSKYKFEKSVHLVGFIIRSSFNTYNFAFRFMLHCCDTTIWLSVPAKDSSWALCGSIKLTHTVCPVTLSTSCCRVVKGVLWLFESHRAVRHVRFRIDTGKFWSWLSLKFITRMLVRWPNSAGTSCNLLLRTLRMVKLVQLPISES